MGQKIHSPVPLKYKYETQNQSRIGSSDNSVLELMTISSGEAKKDVTEQSSESLENHERRNGIYETSKQGLEREEKLLQFTGQIIYYCKMYMKKQRKYHYKISALLFYKYFYDKFRQLVSKYWALYQKQQISREEYEKKVTLVYQIKDTFIKIKKFVYSKIPFLNEKTKSYLDENSEEYCFNKKEFLTELLYPQVGQIMNIYHENTTGQFDQPEINVCYLRMIKSIFIIEELEFNNFVVKSEKSQDYPSYDIDKVENWTQEQIRYDLIKCYKIFSALKRS